MIKIPSDIKAIILDWDDTIAESYKRYAELYCAFAKANKLPLPSDDLIRQHWGQPLGTMLTNFWGGDEDDLRTRFSAFGHAVQVRVDLFPYSYNALKTLKENGFVLAVVSSATRRGIDKTIAFHKIPLEWFHDIQTGEDTPYHKPDPRVFDGILESLSTNGISQEQVIYVGDGLGDLRAAHSRGLAFIAVLTGFTTREQFLQEGLSEDHILDTFEQIPTLLSSKRTG